ncbi:bifunctional folylpolyglutamate synthase/dihydrofolate synthase [Thermoactinomyces sp. AMNI-1]|uniref:tetrahydrofolate synthase n=1 Tax=Thermoactinomyces mirandus TaxID=2756294 RepID=A0A7W2ARS1_9BACL|nr:bifunctional folylpolyglutamate synthase/dihydrofolate synthase [Thermoactinomyces mirandus]
MDQFKTAHDVFSWMEHACAQTIQPGLERMEWMLNQLDHPERRLKFIHIAGTNGKGSTAAMIASVLKEAGYPTGMFVSPYVTSWHERIQFDGQSIEETSFVRWSNELKPLIEKMAEDGPGKPTPFEYWTLVSLCYFAREAFPWFVVWETGMGGRLDSTNVVFPLVSVITEIGYDHKNWLGDTLTEIASEKAGIVKSGVPVVCGSQKEEAVPVIRNISRDHRSPFYLLNKDFLVKDVHQDSDGQNFTFQNVYRELSGLSIPLIGDHQLQNAGTALMTLEVLRQAYATVIEPEHYRNGLRKTFWPGRLEKVSDSPHILLDGAHNIEGINALIQTIKKYHTDCGRIGFLVAVMKDKPVREMMKPLADAADFVTTTSLEDHSRSLAAEELARILKEINPRLSVESVSGEKKALHVFMEKLAAGDLGVVAGSLFLVSAVRPMLLDRK